MITKERLTKEEIDHMVTTVSAGLEKALADVAGERDSVLSINAMLSVMLPTLRFIYTETDGDNIQQVAEATGHAIGAALAHLISEVDPRTQKGATTDILWFIERSITSHLKGLNEEAEKLLSGELQPDEQGLYVGYKMPKPSGS